MTQTIEDRLRLALHEVADRLEEDEPAALQAHHRRLRPSRGRVALAAAAASIVALAIAGAIALRGESTPSTVATEPSRTLLTAEIESFHITLRSEMRNGNQCVVLDEENVGVAPAAPACSEGGRFAVQATALSGRTIVFGFHPKADRFSGTVKEVTAPDLKRASLGDGAAFLLVVDVRAASGTVNAIDEGGATIDTARFDKGAVGRPAKSALGDEALSYAFARDGAIWAVGVDGTEVRLTDGTPREDDSSPSVSPDGRTVLFSRPDFDGVFWLPMAVDVASGETYERQTFASTWSPSGRWLAGMVPLDDTGAPTEIAIVEGDREIARVEVGVNQETGSVSSLAWDGDDRLLVVTRPYGDDDMPDGYAFWTIDVPTRHVTKLNDDVGCAHWIVAERSESTGAFRTICAVEESPAEWGLLTIRGGTMSFEREGWFPADLGDADFEFTPFARLDRRREGSGYLFADGDHLYEVSPGGSLSLVGRGIISASAP